MSRIGKHPVPIPKGVTAKVEGNKVHVKGPKGELERTLHPEMKVTFKDDQITVERPSDDRVNAFARILAQAGLTVSVRKSRGRDIRAACGQLIVEGTEKSAGQKAAALL